jgi:hypothetical protein
MEPDMTIKSHTITYSLNKGQTTGGYLIAQNDAVIGFAFADPMSRLTFFSFDGRLKDLEKMAFRSIEDIEGSLMTYLDGRAGSAPAAEPKREPVSTLG